MAQITVLDQNTINKIAAGEVIERPASVVKELLENAIDAQATAITVEIRDGGTSLIRVTDNGYGIPKEEVGLAFLRHSTSKIRSVEDLFTVSSLGFRGEALSSIAAVAQVELITKTGEQLSGTRYCIEGGEEKSLEEVGAPEGTTFLVRNLFYNTPARRKFLKTPQTEGAHVADLVEKIALSHPDISIRLIHNNQNKLHTSGNHNLKDMIYTIYGREIAANLLSVSSSSDRFQIQGFIGKPVIARGNRNYENYYINGRYIRSSIISKAIEEAYKPFLMQHKYPFTLLHITVKPEYLDVNVHPTKMELRFLDGEQIYQFVRDMVSSALLQKELIPEVDLEKAPEKQADQKQEKEHERPEPFEQRRLEAMARNFQQSTKEPSVSSLPAVRETAVYGEEEKAKQKESRPVVPEQKKSSEQTEPLIRQEQLDFFQEKLLEPKSRLRHQLIGQLFDTYWLVEFNKQLYIIDQHAAHEKVLFEKTVNSLKNREYTSQMVDPPIILTFSQQEELLFQKHQEYFVKMGFEIEHFGGKEYAVRAVPGNLFSIAKKELLMELIDGLSEETSSYDADMIFEKMASISCKAAVKGNNRLSPQEANELIDQLLDLKNPYTCPHGRPNHHFHEPV